MYFSMNISSAPNAFLASFLALLKAVISSSSLELLDKLDAAGDMEGESRSIGIEKEDSASEPPFNL